MHTHDDCKVTVVTGKDPVLQIPQVAGGTRFATARRFIDTVFQAIVARVVDNLRIVILFGYVDAKGGEVAGKLTGPAAGVDDDVGFDGFAETFDTIAAHLETKNVDGIVCTAFRRKTVDGNAVVDAYVGLPFDVAAQRALNRGATAQQHPEPFVPRLCLVAGA